MQCPIRALPVALLATAIVACASGEARAPADARSGGTTMRFDDTANGTEVRVQVGQEFEVALSETPTTGYRWKVASDGTPVCRVEHDAFQPPGPTPGAPGRHAWVFKAAQAGAAVVELEYRRSFGAGEPARRFTLRVVAQ
jgi:predicted secreted protein